MASAKPKVIKKTENELVLRSPDGRTIESLRMPDGSFHLKNSDGEQAVFSREDMAELVSEVKDKEHIKNMQEKFRSVTRGASSKDINLLYPIASVGFTQELYPSVKHAIENPQVKAKILNAFTDYVRLAQEGKCFDIYTNDHKGKSKELADCILEYPKVLVERQLTMDQTVYDKAVSEIEELGELRLPFPKITIISGEKVADDPNNMIRTTTTEQGGSVNLVYSFFLCQYSDYIAVHVLFSRPNEIGNSYYLAHCILHFVDGKLKMSKPIPAKEIKYKLAEEDTIDTMVQLAIIAIHMLTISGGDVYISAPTPNEVAINKKRMNKGKKPLIEFKLITVDGKKSALPSMPHGTHASPRQHWRRGHWRTMKKSGKKVWIDPMLVGDEENGKIIKDYAVGHYEEREYVHH